MLKLFLCRQRLWTRAPKARAVTVRKDGGIRTSTTEAVPARLRPAFTKKGSTTAGNSSQVSDGAAACVVMRRGLAKSSACASWVHFVVRSRRSPAGDWALGRACYRKVLQQTGLSVSDIDLLKLTAFASQASYSIKELGIDMSKVNVNGGAIAPGTTGCTGARMTATLLHAMARRSRDMELYPCIGSGMGAAAVYECDN